MAQAYVTVYEATYIANDLKKVHRPPFDPQSAIYLEAPKADIWIENIGKSTFINAADEDLQKFVKRLYRDRNWTTYQMHYCKNQIASISGQAQVPHVAEDELIEYGKLTFSPKTSKIMKPLPTARKVFGYMRPAKMYTGLSEYQDYISREGYQILLRNYKNKEEKKSIQK